ncbi:hypothetical protein DUNSADRAFT_12561 [Dunaliella salina]|uniref:Encoded protein n=1 Tax=Dunaliella salina TaxID=3046 RepID=A0ABQ7GB31_DUNSA|nr:hypothetical protein DUNSADRAFT_12561 [Dunaliella salina]|eukprot:KAF5831815.1 hypothetical protein DUNSADRAFT_12561 [Dunaliella salina]
MEGQSYGVPMVTYSRLGAVELPIGQDLTDYWRSPDSYFLVQGPMLKEVFEDLEWPGGDVDVVMSQEQQRLAFSASGSSGDLTIDVPVGELSGFYVAPPPPSQDGLQGTGQPVEICHRYRYKALRAAFCNLPNPKEFGGITTKVSIDSSGLLKATHMVCLHGPPSHSQMGPTMPSTLHADPSFTFPSDSQRPDSVRTAVLAFVTVPILAEGDERGEAEAAAAGA